jgi:hypothetical protein
MAATPQTLPLHRPPEVSKYDTSARILAWIVYLGLGFFARLSILALWIFTDLLGDAFGGWVIPALGFLLLPWTTLMYACVWVLGSDTVSGREWIVLAIALLVDYTFLAWSRNAFD